MLPYFVTAWILCGIVGAMIGSSKGAAAEGFAAGFLFGPLGILIAYLLKGDRKKCRYCAELVKKEAIVCPHCQRDLKEEEAVVLPAVLPAIRLEEVDDAVKAMREALKVSRGE
jgi:hypothetical protein